MGSAEENSIRNVIEGYEAYCAQQLLREKHMNQKDTKYKPFDSFTEFRSICNRGNSESERLGHLYPEAIHEVKRLIDAYYSDFKLTDDELFQQYAFVCNSSAYLRRPGNKKGWIIRINSIKDQAKDVATP